MRFPQALAALALAGLLLQPATLAAKELTVGLASEPSSIDPHYHNLTPNNALAREVFDRLIMPDDKQVLKPGLAVSWTAIDDLTWEFKLRQGVKFHDGSPFNADDVIFTDEPRRQTCRTARRASAHQGQDGPKRSTT